MLDSIHVGVTGLQGFSQGLRVIANNTANLNTPGFKTATLQFADLYAGSSGPGSGLMQVGYGLAAGGTQLNFAQGELRQTGNTLDLAVDGQGLFTLQDADGTLRYTRAGQFGFDADGFLVNRTDGSNVLGIGADGTLGKVGIQGLSTTAGQPTTTVRLGGNLSSTAPGTTLSGIQVIDAAGAEHALSITLAPSAADPARWTVEVFEGLTSLGAGEIAFSNGKPVAGSAQVTVSFRPAGQAAQPLVFDFGQDVTSFASGALSSLALRSQDGLRPAELSGMGFDDAGVLVMSYANGQTVKGPRLALGRFDSPDAVRAAGGNAFIAADALAWHMGVAGQAGFGKVRSGVVELSNVDLSQEFSDLVIIQRGYQASSQVISTANEMLQELFSMKRA